MGTAGPSQLADDGGCRGIRCGSILSPSGLPTGRRVDSIMPRRGEGRGAVFAAQIALYVWVHPDENRSGQSRLRIAGSAVG
jgi:hypothetical protein